MPKLTLPSSLLDVPETDRREILAVLLEASKLPAEKELPNTGGDEHNIWEHNSDDLLGSAEDELFEILSTAEAINLMHHMQGMGLDDSDMKSELLDMLDKAFEPEFHAFEDELIKGKDSGRQKMSDKIKEMAKVSADKIKQFMTWVDDGKSLTRTQLSQIDKILSRNLPNYNRLAERFMTRAGFIGKIRSKADQENFSTLGALIDRLPHTVREGEKEGVVLTLREKAKAEAQGKKVKILPLTKQEAESVKHASLHAGDKMTEISQRHMMGVRQLVIQAKRERWTAQQLASKLFDRFGDHNRDWRRVAITELAFCANDAFLAGCEPGDRVIGMGAINACKHCQKLIIGKEFIVRSAPPTHETYTTDTKEVWVGKSNYGRRVAEYVAAVPLHPHCRCRLHKVSRFYKVGEDGKLKLKDTAELIQEERAKRGLAPDPNLKAQSLEALSAQVLKKLNNG